MPQPHWSYSQFSTYLRCPLQYYFRYVARLPAHPLPSGMVLGSVVHATLAHYHSHLQQGTLLPATELQRFFHANWATIVTEGPILYGKDEDEGSVTSQGVGLLDLYRQQPPPTGIFAVEWAKRVPLWTSQGTLLEKPLLAVLDLVLEDEQGRRVREYKTSSRSYTTAEVANSLQATCYAHIAIESWGELVPVEYLVLVKTKTPKVQQLTTTRTPRDLERLGDLAQQIEWAIEQNHFYPNQSPQNCGTCPYQTPCQDWRLPEPSASLECREPLPIPSRNGVSPCSRN